jgi:hypothetical protein
MERSDLRQIGRTTEAAALRPPRPAPTALPGWVGALVGLGLVLAVVVGFLIGQRPVRGLQATVSEQAQTIRGLEQEIAQLREQQVVCDDGGSDLAQIREFLAAGKLEIALGLAEAKLAQASPTLCAESQAALAGLWYSASLDLLLTPHRAWSLEQGAQLVTRYREIEREADRLGVPAQTRIPPMTLATRAYNAGLWALADAAFRQAWERGDIGEAAIPFRYDLLRNWGNELANQDGQGVRPQAVRLLATAHAIAETYHLTKGEACTDLRALGYRECGASGPVDNEPVLRKE